MSSVSSSSSGSLSGSSSSSVVLCGPNDYAITLTMEFTPNYLINGRRGFRIKVTASDPCNIEEEIFRYYRQPANQFLGATEDAFNGVCGWYDMVELPTEAPRAGDNPAAFRRNYFDLVLESMGEEIGEVQELWDAVKEEVQMLINTLAAGATVITDDAVWIGDPL